MRGSIRCAMLVVILQFAQVALPAAPAENRDQPGRRVKVAAIAIGYGGDHDAKLKLAIEHLEVAGPQHVDIACLPEAFAGDAAEEIPGPTTTAIGQLARKHHMYVICPICERAADGRKYNTAVLLDRQGNPAGYYRKVFVFWSEKGCSLSDEGVKTFDTDFGRISLLTCFDANFDEVWREAKTKGAEIVFWPSAYGGGVPLNGYAMIHNYYIVAVGWGNMIDLMGRNIAPVEQPKPKQFIATLDLDLTIAHLDFNGEKVGKLLEERKGEVERISSEGDMEGWYLLRAVAPGVRARDLCKQYGIETLDEYRTRSRAELNRMRNDGMPIP